MLILKFLKKVLEILKRKALFEVDSIKTFDFSTLYTTIPHDTFKKLVSTVKKLYARHHDLVNPYNVAVSKLILDLMVSDEAK